MFKMRNTISTMTLDAPTLLSMLETIDPTDSTALDALDLHVSHFLAHPLPLCYSRSRDVLKSIRPEGFLVKIEIWPSGPSVMGCFIDENGYVTTFESGGGPTEELCELHVIIQAVAYRRSKVG